MIDSPPPDLAKQVALLWGRLMTDKRFQSATLVALLGYFLALERKNDP